MAYVFIGNLYVDPQNGKQRAVFQADSESDISTIPTSNLLPASVAITADELKPHVLNSEMEWK